MKSEIWLSKQEAAKAAGIGIRQLENHARRGRIRKQTLKRQAGEKTARVVYSESDIKALVAGDPNQHMPAVIASAGAIAPRVADPFAGLAAQLAALARAFPPPAETKPWLTLREAAAHTGLPARWLRDQARAGKLRAENVGEKRERWMFPREALR